MSNIGWIRRSRQGRLTSAADADPREPRSAMEIALIVLAALASIAALYLAKQVLAPLLMAVFFAVLLTPVVERLHSWGLPRSAAAALLLVAGVMLLGALLDQIKHPAYAWLERAPDTLHIIERKIRPVQRLLAIADQFGMRAEHVASGSPVAASPPNPPARQWLDVAAIATALPALGLAILTSIVVTFFLLASGPPLLAKIVGAAAGTSVRRALSTVEAIRRKLGRYYTTVAVINLGLGTATAIVMGLLGMPTPLLWGTIAATFNFVPYLGSACTLLILTGVALVSFDSLGHVAAVVGSFLALATLEGQVVQPLFVGRRLELRPLAVLLGVWLLGALWGLVGIILAVPILLTVKVALSTTRGARALRTLLGADEPRERRRLGLPRRGTRMQRQTKGTSAPGVLPG
jgi:predicted PurR-regulated permease PerM